jgi:hypothetical protein
MKDLETEAPKLRSRAGHEWGRSRLALGARAAGVVGVLAAAGLAPAAGSGAHGDLARSVSGSATQPSGTIAIGPATLATSATSTLQNYPSCSGGTGCTYIQWAGSSPDSSYASPVDGTIVAWRISSGSAGNKVKLRILRPAGGGKLSAVASSATETTSGSSSTPDQFAANIPVKAGDIIGLDNSNDALVFKTGVLGSFPEFWTPFLPDGSSPSPPTAPSGTIANGYQIQIGAYIHPSPGKTTTSTTTSTPTTTTVTTVTTTTTTPTTSIPKAPAGKTALGVTAVRLSASWKNSRLSGKVHFSIGVRGPSQLTAAVREGSAGPIRAERRYSTTRGGTFPETLRLPPGTPPGTYFLVVRGTTGRSKQAHRATTFKLEAPPEGIVDQASISLLRGGTAATTVEPPEKALWARFHFLARPSGAGKVKIVWRTPSYKLVGAVTKPFATTVDSSVHSSAPLAPGRWYAILSVGDKVVKRIGVRIA